MSAKIHKLANHEKDNVYKSIIIKTKDIIQKELNEMMSEIFDDTDDILFNSAESAAKDSDRNSLFDMMRLLRIERNTITNNYIQSITKKVSTPAVEATTSDTEELSLVSHEEMEEMVAITSIANRLDNLHNEALSHLHARAEHLSLKTKFTFNNEALSPKQFCEDFISASNHIEFDTNSKLIFIKVFSKHLDEALGKIYDTINYRLIEAGILPQIKVTAKKQESHQTPKHHEDQYYNMAPLDSQQPSYNNQQSQDLNQVIHSYIQNNLQGQVAANINQQKFYDRNQVLKSLSNLQLKFSQTNQLINFDLINNALISNINTGQGGVVTKQVNQVDEKTIEVIELLFNEILTDEAITNSVRTLILRLQIPIIKVSMLDQEFFNNPDHPARAFLNTLSFVGIGITDDDDEFLSRIEIIIDTLLNEYEQDSISFQQALDSLNSLFDKETDTCQKKENHTQKRILQEHARKIVLQELQLYAHNMIIDKKSEPLVLKLWPTRMYQQYIQHGKGSEQWNTSVNTLRLIINSIQIPTTQKELQFLVTNQDVLQQNIQDELYESKQDMDSVNLAIYTLSETYLENINHADINNPEENNFDTFSLETFSGTISDIQNINAGLPAANNDIDLSLDMPEPVKDKREQLQLLPNEIKPGLWFELYDGENKSVRRLKLSVIIMEEAQLIFVNRQGVKIMEKNAMEFAEELEKKQSKIIADHSVFDQALNNVISALSASA